MTNGSGTVWTNVRVELLKKLWAEDASASHIAAKLGCFRHCDDDGRSSVLGKIHRLGLSEKRKEGSSIPGPKKPRGGFTSTRSVALAQTIAKIAAVKPAILKTDNSPIWRGNAFPRSSVSDPDAPTPGELAAIATMYKE